MTKPLQLAPPITDHLPIALRAFAILKVTEKKKVFSASNAKLKRKSSTLPASPWVIVFDTETTTGPEQRLRFGTYQVLHKGKLDEAGIFYEPAAVSANELDVLQAHTQTHVLQLITRDEFADRIFYKVGYNFRACFVGFNLPFDISRIAIGHGSARTEMRGGFTFKLTTDKLQPNLQVKHISQKCAFIRFAAPMKQLDNRSDRRRKRQNPVRRGHFIDLKTLAGAMFARPFSLSSLSEFLKVPSPKLDFEDFDGPITDEMVTYAVRDVQASWECYCELSKRYEQLGIPQTPPEKIYSEASIGKGYLRGMGIQSWKECQPDFPDQITANILSSYFGGRSEIRIRRELREVMLCDFLSMYPTVCTVMKLWPFVTARGMTHQDTTVQTRDWLERINIASLKLQSTWPGLTTLVRVHPNTDIFPVRASYGEGDQTTIAANYISSDFGHWFTLADCVAAKLLTGKSVEIVEALTFKPMEPQAGLQPALISGKADYAVDPVKDDFYKRVIELRQATKIKRDQARGVEWEALDTEQNALKIAANATSYGVFAEINVADKPEAVDLTVLSGTDQPFNLESKMVEETGPFFHPLLATLITGAARLMLALTETLVQQSGLNWAFCDTDSMAIAKPLEMTTDDFHKSVRSVVDWFDDLNPYDFKSKILKIEDVNFDHTDPKKLKPLYCWAVSAKRYALFNLDSENKPIIRKASGHGLGHLQAPYTERNPPSSIPKPVIPVHKIGKGFKLWQHDLWWQIISSALEGHANSVDLGFHPAFELPAISHFGLTTPHLLNYFKGYNKSRSYNDQARPFGFMTGLTANPFDETEDLNPNLAKRRQKESRVKPIAPYTRDPQKAATTAFCRETGLAVAKSKLMTFKEVLATYHMQHENKFLNGAYWDFGATKRRHINVTAIRHIGKDANRLEEQMVLGIDKEANPDYGLAPDQSAAMLAELRGIADILGRRAVANEFGITKSKLASILGGKCKVKFSTSSFDELRKAANAFVETRAAKLTELRSSVAKLGLRATARLMGCDAANLKRQMGGSQRRTMPLHNSVQQKRI